MKEDRFEREIKKKAVQPVRHLRSEKKTGLEK